MESILYGSKQIDFQLQYKRRKTLGITIKPSLEVIVKAPENATLDKIKEKVRKRASWVLKQQSYFLSFQPTSPPKKYISGETHLYMGRQYRLWVQTGEKNSVAYKGRFIEVITKDKTKTKDLMRSWYRLKAKTKYAEIAEPLIQRFKRYGVEPKGIYLLEMPTRWGSCTPKGKIILNPELIKAPKPCIEYVIIHELCHLVHPHHNKKFVDLQSKEMPDWEKWKSKLEVLLA